MQPTCTFITSRRLNAIALLAIRAVRKDAGVKAPRIVKSLVKSIVRRNVRKEDALVQSQESAVT